MVVLTRENVTLKQTSLLKQDGSLLDLSVNSHCHLSGGFCPHLQSKQNGKKREINLLCRILNKKENLIGKISIYIRQRFPLYRAKCRAQLDTLFNSVLSWFYPSSRYLVAAFEI
jgi:hypothetical protein